MKYPEVSRRYVSSLVDGLLVFVSAAAIGIALEGDSPTLVTLRIVLILAVISSYEPLLSSQACTMGQFATGIRVRSYEDPANRISLGRAYLRFAVKVLLGFYSFFALSFNKERRAVHDLVGESIVLDRRWLQDQPSEG